MKVQVAGTVKKVFATQEFDSGFKKRQFVLKVDEYTEILLEMQKDNVDYLDKIKEGDKVDTTFFVNGRHWKEDKWFNTLVCVYIKGMQTEEPKKEEAVQEYNDDLPF
jgi:hypothetical protein